MVIMIPMGIGGGAIELTKRPNSWLMIGALVALVGYFTVSITASLAFIDLPALFGVETEPRIVELMAQLSSFFFAFAFIIVGFMGLITTEKARWWRWTLYGLGAVAMFLWIPMQGAAIEGLLVAYCDGLNSASWSGTTYGCRLY